MKQHASRRASVVFGVVLTGMMVLSGVLGAVAWPNATLAAEATTNAQVNLRTGPGEFYDILTVVPVGGVISIDGDAVDGFAPVTYNGVSGWLSVSYVVAAGTAPIAAYDTQAPTGELAATANGEELVYSNDSGSTNQDRARRNRTGNTPATVTTTNGTTTTTTAPDGAIANPGTSASNEQEIIGIIHQAAAAYGQSPADMERVARCESSLNPRAVDPSGSYHGLFQFVPSTFAGTPYGDQDIYDPWANAHAAAWMWSEGRRGEWVCQ